MTGDGPRAPRATAPVVRATTVPARRTAIGGVAASDRAARAIGRRTVIVRVGMREIAVRPVIVPAATAGPPVRETGAARVKAAEMIGRVVVPAATRRATAAVARG